MLLRSTQLTSIAHGFPTRRGGVSTGRFASLNLLRKWGDDPTHVAENRRRLAAAGGFTVDRLFTARQVHGAAVAVIGRDDQPAAVAEQDADALVTDVPGVALGVGTADCVPILIADGEGRVAAAHAGWRGSLADVAGAAVEALVTLGARRDRLRAALGPSICPACFEVGPEVAEMFAPVAGVVDRTGARPHVDLRRANRSCLERAGLAPEAIDDRPPCTMCDAERFFSYRRDGGGIGQHLAFVVARRPA